MKPNVKKLKQLVDNNFNGNKSAFANEIGVDRGQVSKILKDGTCAGSQFYGGLFVYCEKEKLNFKEFIFLPNNVKKINKTNRTA
ncbi:hypothetical protein [Tepidibacter hydrothermalis]|uniref:Transcriptional regulator n=1 Tax=Tepidibacter hydrothermalis TaxID=3036126 RepID=A0ABY8EIX4_9FIRM|nr:hypothetical protein [Tepidibacter hydrothermalis]WFD11980.1 hypothetical protein P4S50_07855 [Tepidibacter hydrothermalis]